MTRAATVVPAVALAAVLAAACSPNPPVPAATPSARAAASQPTGVAPWVDVTAQPLPDLAAVARSGVRTLNLGFVTAEGGACRPSWGGTTPIDAPSVTDAVRAFRDAGGEVRVSFGGADGVELARACPTSGALAAAYGEVVAALGVRLVDLDVEGSTLEDAAAVHRRTEALRTLAADAEERGRPLELTVTLPVEPDGLTAAAQALLRDAHDAGLRPAVVDVLAMNYAGEPEDLVAAGLGAVDATRAFVASLWRDDPPRIAATLMIGVNDIRQQVVRASDAERFVTAERERGPAWVGFWSLGRDRPCAAGVAVLSPSCSGTAEPPGAYLAAFSRAAGAVPAG